MIATTRFDIGMAEGTLEIDADTLKQWQQEKPDLMIIDVRTLEETDQGTIDDAVEIDYYAPDFTMRLLQLDSSKTYVLYCRTGARSLDAVAQMREMGFDQSYSLKGGYIEWVA